jgi:hypothetical protein
MVTNQLFSLVENHNDMEEILPPMPTKRDCAIAFSYGHFLVVAGGVSEGDRTVEVLDSYRFNAVVRLCSSP